MNSTAGLRQPLGKQMAVLCELCFQTLQAFSDEFKKFPNASGGPFSKLTSTPDMCETKMGTVTIQAVTGDITKETTDIIVNSSNESFSLKSGVSKAILEAAGEAVKVECYNFGAKSIPGMIMTQSGKLKCKKILHVVGHPDPVKINKIVKDALQLCVKTSYTSVSFPAIGTGQDNLQARLVADAMLDAVIDVLSQNTSSPLTTIRIVIFQKPILKDFHSSMEQRTATDPNPKDKGQGTWGGIFSKVKGMFTGGNAENPCFHICGDTQADVDLAKKLLLQNIQTIKIEENARMLMLSRKRDEDIPDRWERLPAKTTCQAFAVKANTPEYNEILKLFKTSCNGTVEKIERIQNPVLWKSLQIKKHDMEVRNSHQNNERRLFHGTCDTTVPIINERGFNRSYSGKNAAFYGNGTYFAVSASYSANDTYSKPNQKGEKFMYVCRVLTGDFTLGQKGMIEPPAKNPGSTDMYDSVVDNLANPTMFVVFHDAQAYPEYLITFK